ncbi:hypothetical protein C8R45DRAFT_814572 [Mycena sanguinolenta]|nr:hypothetical protein C8R45DRAFT_814572 [Mycena sanguinolenta]
MPNCSICVESLRSPVSLPCGHCFCRECILRTVAGSSSSPNSQLQPMQSCPACMAPYSLLNVDPAFVPPYLRPHIRSPIRRVCLDDPQASTSASTSTSAMPTPPALARAEAELNALRTECSTWRRRAETHAAANHTLLSFTRAAKDYALRLRAERDAERNKCVLLKRKLAELMCVYRPSSPSCQY